MPKMKAARIFGEKDIRVVEIPVPELEPDEVLIKVKAVGLCGTDVELYEGTMPYIKKGLTTLPITPGHEWAGIVEKTGSEVTNVVNGDRVTGDVYIVCGDCDNCKKGRYNLCTNNKRVVGSYRNKDGGFAEYIKMPARNLYKIPDNISFNEAALIENAATCVYGIEKMGIEYGSSVLVIGDGPIGQMALQVAGTDGAGELLISGSYDNKLEIARQLGATHTINRHQQDVVDAVMDFTDGEGVDVVIESCGKEKGLEQALAAVKPGGKLCLLSIYTKDKLNIDVNSIIFKDLDVIGSLGSANSFQPAINMLKTNKIRTDKIITKELPLEDAEKAFDLVYEERDKMIKIVLKP